MSTWLYSFLSNKNTKIKKNYEIQDFKFESLHKVLPDVAVVFSTKNKKLTCTFWAGKWWTIFRFLLSFFK